MTRTTHAILILLLCGCTAFASVGCSQADGPQAVFERMKAATAANDLPGMCACLEPSMQKLMAGQMVTLCVATAIAKGDTAAEAELVTSLKPLGVAIENLIETLRKMQEMGVEVDPAVVQKTVTDSLIDAKDLPAVLKAALDWMQKHLEAFAQITKAAMDQARASTANSTLTNVQVTGNIATGTVTPSNEAVKFVKVAGQWYLSVPQQKQSTEPPPPPPPDDKGWQTDLHIVAHWWHATRQLGAVDQQMMKWRTDGMSGPDAMRMYRDMADQAYDGLVAAYRVGDEISDLIPALRRIHPELKDRWASQMESTQTLILVFEDIRDGVYASDTELPADVVKTIQRVQLDTVLYLEWVGETRSTFDFPPDAVLEKKIEELFGPQAGTGDEGTGDGSGAGTDDGSAPDNAGSGSSGN